jgi:hypothetical protein
MPLGPGLNIDCHIGQFPLVLHIQAKKQVSRLRPVSLPVRWDDDSAGELFLEGDKLRFG